MRRIVLFLCLIANLLIPVSAPAGNTPAPLSTPELQKMIGSGKKSTIVFFQNPMGGPCRAQNEILQKLTKDRKGRFNIASISTMRPEDQRAFYEYGVRNLPTIVLVGKDGAIYRYFPPGVQSYETLAAALDEVR